MNTEPDTEQLLQTLADTAAKAEQAGLTPALLEELLSGES